jgi:hypothetical protein
VDAQRASEMRLIVSALYAATIANGRDAALQGVERSGNWIDKQRAYLDRPMVVVDAEEEEEKEEECVAKETYLDAIDLA